MFKQIAAHRLMLLTAGDKKAFTVQSGTWRHSNEANIHKGRK